MLYLPMSVRWKELGTGVAMLNDVCHSAVVKCGCVSSRILWIKFKFSRVKVCVVVGYGPIEGDGEEREVQERHGQDSG